MKPPFPTWTVMVAAEAAEIIASVEISLEIILKDKAALRGQIEASLKFLLCPTINQQSGTNGGRRILPVSTHSKRFDFICYLLGISNWVLRDTYISLEHINS